MKELHLNRREVRADDVEALDAKDVIDFPGRAQVRRPLPIGVDQRVVPQCLHADHRAIRLDDPRQFGDRLVKVDVVQRAILHTDEHWLATDWSPRMARTTLQRAAIVQSADFFNHTVIDRVVRTVLPVIPFPIKYFASLEEAEAWLHSASEVTA